MAYQSMLRFAVVLLLAAAPVAAGPQEKKAAAPAAKPAATEGTVYMTPTCGCCGKWVTHMAAANFKLTREMHDDMDSVPAHQRVPAALRSCHTAVIGPYLIEGHVPADVVRQLLKERPKIAGLSAPNMPAGSPGMDAPNAPAYSIVAFRADGTTYEFAKR